MILFIDTANLKEIEEAAKWGYVKGCTTNPSLIAKEGLTQKEVITKITKLIDGPISAEVTSEEYEGMIEQGKELFAIDPRHIVIKLPNQRHPLLQRLPGSSRHGKRSHLYLSIPWKT